MTSSDFYPTLLEAAGLPLRAEQHVDGQSFLPLMRGERMDRGPIFWHYPHYGNQGGRPYAAVRLNEWKLIEFYEDRRLELYNVVDDIGESLNRASELPGLVRQLYGLLEEWRLDAGAIIPEIDPEWCPSSGD
ncbi:MAG TPA: hypothetical protein DD727_07385 [Clostridiales bacterium]|nr:hypothetical protein [Clostridiales bacterium]